MPAETRFYLQRPSTGQGLLVIVERVDDARGYRLLCSDRHHAREELPHLRRLTQSIGEPVVAHRLLDATDYQQAGTSMLKGVIGLDDIAGRRG